MAILFEYVWALFIATTIANALFLKYRSREHVRLKPELKEGYDKFFKGIIIYGNIPWVIVAIGNLCGITNNLFEYFNPKLLNPAVLVFHGSVIALWLVSIYWVYFNGGAEFIERHPGLFNKKGFEGKRTEITAKQVKLFLPLMLAGGVAALAMMWVVDFPAPQF
jgi:hypothetical protein